MTIKQSVINTFDRVGIDYEELEKRTDKVKVANWITGVEVETTPLVAECVEFIYRTSLAYERGYSNVRLDDFDRIKYFILDADHNCYMECID